MILALEEQREGGVTCLGSGGVVVLMTLFLQGYNGGTGVTGFCGL